MPDDLLPKTSSNTLSVEHQRLLTLVNSMSDGVIALDQKLSSVLSNSAALNLLDVNGLSGQPIEKAVTFYDAKDHPIPLAKIIASTTSTYTTRDWLVKYKDGSQANIFVSISPVKTGYGTDLQSGWVIILRDITKEKSLEEERNDFISVTSHELRTPIAVTEGNVSNARMLAEKSGASEEILHSLAAAHDQTIFLGNLINDLAMLSKANRGELALTIEPIDVGAVLGKLAGDYRPAAEAKGLSFQLEIDPNVGTLVSSELYVREILQNFITNSLKYTDKGTITLSAHRNGENIVFAVADTGYGISKSDQNGLFKKFFRSEDWRVQKASGTGLGLYVTAKLIKLIGGQLDIESELDKGTKMTLAVSDYKKTENP